MIRREVGRSSEDVGEGVRFSVLVMGFGLDSLIIMILV